MVDFSFVVQPPRSHWKSAFEPGIKNQLPMLTERTGDLLHRLDAGTHCWGVGNRRCGTDDRFDGMPTIRPSEQVKLPITPFLHHYRKPRVGPPPARCAVRIQMTDCSGDAIVQTRDFMPRA